MEIAPTGKAHKPSRRFTRETRYKLLKYMQINYRLAMGLAHRLQQTLLTAMLRQSSSETRKIWTGGPGQYLARHSPGKS